MDRQKEYMIEWERPEEHNPSAVLRKLPSPIAPGLREIYNYSVKENGFYLVDREIDDAVAGQAMKLFVNEALAHCDEVRIRKL